MKKLITLSVATFAVFSLAVVFALPNRASAQTATPVITSIVPVSGTNDTFTVYTSNVNISQNTIASIFDKNGTERIKEYYAQNPITANSFTLKIYWADGINTPGVYKLRLRSENLNLITPFVDFFVNVPSITSVVPVDGVNNTFTVTGTNLSGAGINLSLYSAGSPLTGVSATPVDANHITLTVGSNALTGTHYNLYAFYPDLNNLGQSIWSTAYDFVVRPTITSVVPVDGVNNTFTVTGTNLSGAGIALSVYPTLNGNAVGSPLTGVSATPVDANHITLTVGNNALTGTHYNLYAFYPDLNNLGQSIWSTAYDFVVRPTITSVVPVDGVNNTFTVTGTNLSGAGIALSVYPTLNGNAVGSPLTGVSATPVDANHITLTVGNNALTGTHYNLYAFYPDLNNLGQSIWSAAYDFVVSAAAPIYTVTPIANPNAGGSVSGGGNSYTDGASATVVATANTGYTFQNWVVRGTSEVVSASSSYTFTVTADETVVAHFTHNVAATDYSALTAEINVANGVLASSTVGSANGNYSQNDYTTLSGAIDAANAVKNNASASQVDVNTAVQTLTSAVTTFQNNVIVIAAQQGVPVITSVHVIAESNNQSYTVIGNNLLGTQVDIYTSDLSAGYAMQTNDIDTNHLTFTINSSIVPSTPYKLYIAPATGEWSDPWSFVVTPTNSASVWDAIRSFFGF